nr:hypothetical protein [uncultured Flavobacterium sp.]
MRTLYIFTLLMISNFAKSQDLKCADFKIGTFKIETTNYKLPISKVIRTENVQKESSENSKELEGKIEWKTECVYELVYLNASPEMNGKKVTVEIIKVQGTKAICTSTFEGMPGFMLNFEMVKLN